MLWEDLTIIDLETWASPQILERGRIYLAEGHLRHSCRFGRVLAGELIGGGANYRARIWIEQEEVSWKCTCPYPDFCKHLTALTLAWLERREEFHQLDDRLTELLVDSNATPKLLRELISKDPLNFLEILEPFGSDNTQISNRGILNLIRTIFKRPYLQIGEAESLWEQVQRLQGLLAGRIGEGDPEAVGLLKELFIGFLKNFNDENRPILQDYCRSLVSLIARLPKLFTGPNWQPFGQELLDYYFTPDFWDRAAIIREALKEIAVADPSWFGRVLEQHLAETADYRILIGAYELMMELISENLQWLPYIERIEAVLLRTPTGRLWLIDRWWKRKPDKVLRWIKEGLRTGDNNIRRAFRERLINLHQQRGEFKQAAALSYLHFQEEPVFEEYLRLKELRGNSNDWRNYLKKIYSFLSEQKYDLLLLQIAYFEQDFPTVERCFQRVKENRSDLLKVAKLFKKSNLPDLSGVLIALIEALIEEGTPLFWNWALICLAVYKKDCLSAERLRDWEELSLRLNRNYGPNSKFNQKFGSILNLDSGAV